MVVYCTSAVAGPWFILHDLVDVSLTHLLLTLHGAAACAVLLAVGSLLRVHVRAGLLRRSIVAQPSVRSARPRQPPHCRSLLTRKDWGRRPCRPLTGIKSGPMNNCVVLGGFLFE